MVKPTKQSHGSDPKGVDVFKQKKLPLLQVILSQPFSKNSRQYSVVGQVVSPFPFITYFDVYDERLDRLFHLRDHLIKEKRIASVEGTTLEPIYERIISNKSRL